MLIDGELGTLGGELGFRAADIPVTLSLDERSFSAIDGKQQSHILIQYGYQALYRSRSQQHSGRCPNGSQIPVRTG